MVVWFSTSSIKLTNYFRMHRPMLSQHFRGLREALSVNPKSGLIMGNGVILHNLNSNRLDQ